MRATVTDVEQIKKRARKMAASQVLAGGEAYVSLPLGEIKGCRTCIVAGYGALSKTPQAAPHDRLIWVLDGYAEVHDDAGQAIHVSQGESTVLIGGKAYRLVFPQLTIYLSVEPEETS